MKKYNVETLEINKETGELTFYRDIKNPFNASMKIYNNHPKIQKEWEYGEMIITEKGNKIYMLPIDLDGIKLSDEYLLSNYSIYKKENLIVPIINEKANLLENIRTFTNDVLTIAQLSRDLTHSLEFTEIISFVDAMSARRSKAKGGVYARK